jgi:CRISPR-associated protein Csx14
MNPLNPGQFFACCGLLELVTLDNVGALSRFVLDAFRPRAAEFIIETQHNHCISLTEVLTRLKEAHADYPDENIEPAVRPVSIPYSGTSLILDWWLNEFRDGTKNLKCWAGQVTTKNLVSELLTLLDYADTAGDLFDCSSMAKAKFGVDPRSAWNALDVGFSPNEHGRDSATFPAVEILAAIGLQGFRPKAERRDGVCYCLWQTPLPAAVARLAFSQPWAGLPHRRYSFAIRKRGQSYKYFTFAVDLGKEAQTNEYNWV